MFFEGLFVLAFPFSDLIEKIRSLVNMSRKHEQLSASVDFNPMCSALDVIGDTELAIHTYLSEDWPNSDGANYIIVYGILQVLFVQQDALLELIKLLNQNDVQLKQSIENWLEPIRDIRNQTVGHPIRQGPPSKKDLEVVEYSHFITRMFLTKNTFEYLSFCNKMPNNNKNRDAFADEILPLDVPLDFEKKNVDILGLIESQQTIVVAELNRIIEHLITEEKEHRDQFKSIKLAPLFQDLSLNCQDIQQAILKFEGALKDRGENSFFSRLNTDFTKDELDVLLNRYGQKSRKTSQNDKQIYEFCIKLNIWALQEAAQYIDDDYELDFAQDVYTKEVESYSQEENLWVLNSIKAPLSKKETLAGLLGNLSYPLGKIDDPHQGAVCIDEIETTLTRIKIRIAKYSEISCYQIINNDIDNLIYALNRLSTSNSDLEPFSEKCYVIFIREKVCELQKNIESINERDVVLLPAEFGGEAAPASDENEILANEVVYP